MCYMLIKFKEQQDQTVKSNQTGKSLCNNYYQTIVMFIALILDINNYWATILQIHESDSV